MAKFIRASKKFIKISQSEEKYYHGTTTGENDSILKSMLSSGIDPKIAQGHGQGAGFYVFNSLNKAKKQAMSLSSFFSGGEVTFEYAGNPNTLPGGYPMVVSLPVDLKSEIFDIDYESLPRFGFFMVREMLDLLKSLPQDAFAELDTIRSQPPIPEHTELAEREDYMDGEMIRLRNKPKPIRKQKKASFVNDALKEYESGSVVSGYTYHKILEILKKNFPEEFKKAEQKVLEILKPLENYDYKSDHPDVTRDIEIQPVAFKYNGKYNIHIDPALDIMVYFNNNWISGQEYMQQKESANNPVNSTPDQSTKTSRNKNMAKFIKTALLEVKERTEQQEVQLEEVRRGETYQSLYEALQKQHKAVDAKTLCELFTPLHKNTNYNSLEEALGNKAGLYGRKNEELAEKSFSEILEEIEKGFPEEILELQLRNKK